MRVAEKDIFLCYLNAGSDLLAHALLTSVRGGPGRERMGNRWPPRALLPYIVKAREANLAGFQTNNAGSDLLSHTVSHAVPSAVSSLTSVFGMGTGVTLIL